MADEVPEYLSRLQDEINDLEMKLMSLVKFIGSNQRPNLRLDQVELMSEQTRHMRKYLKVLYTRFQNDLQAIGVDAERHIQERKRRDDLESWEALEKTIKKGI